MFRRAVELLDPLVRTVLDETDREFLRGTGTIEHRPVAEEASGDAVAGWELSWPDQREAENVRGGDRVGPVQVVAWFAAGFTHPHLRGSQAGNWPLQVTSEADARRGTAQAPPRRWPDATRRAPRRRSRKMFDPPGGPNEIVRSTP